MIEELKNHVAEPNWKTFGELANNAKQGDGVAQQQIVAGLVWCAFSCPEGVAPIYDALAQVYLDGQSAIEQPLNASFLQVELPMSFWHAFQQVLDGPEGGYDALSITAAVASLGGAVGDGFHDAVEKAAINHEGAAGVTERSLPPLMSLEQIEDCPEGSLGHALYRMLVDNGYDPEVLDREAIGLSQLKPTVKYLNMRILQMHDVWHLVAGYQTTSLHEIAISGFQLAQFGHNYSAMFLATVGVMSQKNSPEAFNLMMQIILESWRHGRLTPPLMAISFEDEWNQPVEDIRQRYRISTFQGSYPADLLEQLASAGTG